MITSVLITIILNLTKNSDFNMVVVVVVVVVVAVAAAVVVVHPHAPEFGRRGGGGTRCGELSN